MRRRCPRPRFLVWLLATLLLASGLSAAPADVHPTPTPDKTILPKHTIVFLGDSLTAGYGLNPGEAYPALIQKALTARGWPWLVVNAGESGDTSKTAFNRLDWVLGQHQQVDILVIALGGNDALRGLPPAQLSKNLDAIIVAARQRFGSIKIVLAGMLAPPELGKDYTDAFAAVYPALAKQDHVTLLPFLLEGVAGDDKLNQADHIHPNAVGAQRVSATVWDVLVPLIRPGTAAVVPKSTAP